MINDVVLDFEIHWRLKLNMSTDPFQRNIREIKRFPYRVYINDELVSERVFDIKDRRYIHETHWLTLPRGQYAIKIVDISTALEYEIKNLRLNTVQLPSIVFNIA